MVAPVGVVGVASEVEDVAATREEDAVVDYTTGAVVAAAGAKLMEEMVRVAAAWERAKAAEVLVWATATSHCRAPSPSLLSALVAASAAMGGFDASKGVAVAAVAVAAALNAMPALSCRPGCLGCYRHDLRSAVTVASHLVLLTRWVD